MEISDTHETAREEACRVPALEASLALLVKNTAAAYLELYGTVQPDAGEDTTGDPVVTIDLDDDAGSVDEDEYQLILTTPVEGQITGADDDDGTVVIWGRIYDGSGTWWADVTVSTEDGDGDIKLESTTLYNGAYCRITTAIIQG